jgi:rare lipoprotein A
VTNLDNNRSLIVRVNDRGPFHGDRVIDLSYAAAMKLGYAERGTARVHLESIVVSDNNFRSVSAGGESTSLPDFGGRRPASTGEKYLQIGAFSELQTAQQVSDQVRRFTQRPVFIRTVNSSSNGVLHRVRVGPVSDAGEIRQLSQRVVAANLGSPYTITE